MGIQEARLPQGRAGGGSSRLSRAHGGPGVLFFGPTTSGGTARCVGAYRDSSILLLGPAARGCTPRCVGADRNPSILLRRPGTRRCTPGCIGAHRNPLGLSDPTRGLLLGGLLGRRTGVARVVRAARSLPTRRRSLGGCATRRIGLRRWFVALGWVGLLRRVVGRRLAARRLGLGRLAPRIDHTLGRGSVVGVRVGRPGGVGTRC